MIIMSVGWTMPMLATVETYRGLCFRDTSNNDIITITTVIIGRSGGG